MYVPPHTRIESALTTLLDCPRLCTRMASCRRERPCPWKIGGENSDRAYGEAQANLRP